MVLLLKEKKYLLIFFILISVIITGVTPILSAGVLITVLFTVLTIYLLIKRDVKTLKFIIYIVVFQNFVIILSTLVIKNESIISVLQMYKEIFVISLFMFSLTSKYIVNKFPTLLFFCMLLFLQLFIYLLLIGDQSLYVKLLSFRQIAIPILLILVGMFIKITEDEVYQTINLLVKIGVLVVVFGFLEIFIFSEEFWKNIGLLNYLGLKRGLEGIVLVNGNLPLNFVTFDYHLFMGSYMRRMASFIANPPVLGHFLSFVSGLILIMDKKKSKKMFTFAFVSLGIFLTLGKGGIIIFLINIVFYFYYILKLRKTAINLTILTGAIGLYYVFYSLIHNLSVMKHFDGLFAAIKSLYYYPLGRGLAEAGNLSVLHGETDIEIGESFIGLVLGQLGILGLGLFLIIFLMLIIYLNKAIKKFNKNPHYNGYKLAVILKANLIGIIITSIVSESAISFVGSGLPILFTGIYIKNFILSKEGTSKNEDMFN